MGGSNSTDPQRNASGGRWLVIPARRIRAGGSGQVPVAPNGRLTAPRLRAAVNAWRSWRRVAPALDVAGVRAQVPLRGGNRHDVATLPGRCVEWHARQRGAF